MGTRYRDPKSEVAVLSSGGRLHSLASFARELRFEGRHEGLRRLKEWIAENGTLTLTRDQAARIACLEPHHFSKVFNQHVGMKFQEWRRLHRIAWAVVALGEGKRSLVEVIRLSGYGDRRAFERAVKRLTGMTPGDIHRGTWGVGVCGAFRDTQPYQKPQTSHLEPQRVLSPRDSIMPGNFPGSFADDGLPEVRAEGGGQKRTGG